VIHYRTLSARDGIILVRGNKSKDLDFLISLVALRRNVNLGGATLKDADLSDAKLSGANLSDADLSHADLTGADLRRADLFHANLSSAEGITNEQLDA
jgi:uncharacterized protein YjbI with pentapeptide repeats